MSDSEKNAISYDKICGKWTLEQNKTQINNCIVELAKYLKKNVKVLDIGCGSGYPIDQDLVEKGFHVTGVDISGNMIERAKSLNLRHAEFIHRDFFEFTSEEKFDGIIAFDSLWHMGKDRQREIYTRISGFAEQGAYLLFTHGSRDHQTEGKMFGEKFYYAAIDRAEVHALLESNGFTIVSTIENYAEQTTGERDLLVIARKG